MNFIVSKNQKKIRTILTSICISITILSTISGFAADEETPLNFDLSWSHFRGNDSLRLIEFYLSIPIDKLTFVPDENNFKLGFNITLQASIDDSIYIQRTIKHPFSSATDKIEDENKRLLAVETLFLKPGSYEMRTEVTDLYGDSKKAVTFPVTIDPIEVQSLDLSDIQLATLIQRDTVRTQFYKNGYKVLPNVSNVFGEMLPALFYYSEIYNFAYNSPTDTARYLVTRRITNAENEVVKEFPAKLKNKPGSSAVELGRINIISIPSGSYVFEVEVQDLATNKIVKESEKFFVYRQKDYLAQADSTQKTQADISPEIFPDTRYTIMTDKEIDAEFESTKYISTKDERNTFKKLDLTGKRQFLIEFWAKRDPNVNTKKNEFRDLYLSRVKYANEQFKGFRDGWKTDRGRILLIYGEPDEIDRSPFSSETKPYQIWKYYSLQGGVEFIFVDKRNFGDLELVHSTARGELSDYNWQRWISTSN